ncbi:MAG: hypothetical protein K2J62_02600 [Bacteroidales bacterium]|nr:hypothetical protein [Bacteroidales bacterium]
MNVGAFVPNRLNLEFSSDAPMRKMTTDATAFSLLGRKVCLSPVLDFFDFL